MSSARSRRRLVFLFLIPGVLLATTAGLAEEKPRVHVIKVDGIINPVSAEFIVRSIHAAEKARAAALVIELDTPGGLMESMKDIVKEMLAAEVPLIVYVYPSGSGAVSAGTFIAMAANILAMAPGTNIGAAHPLMIGGSGEDTSKVITEKATNWASAFIRSVAAKRGRNADWAEKAVRQSKSITEVEALKQRVIDFIAPSVDSLLVFSDGRKVEVGSGNKVTLHTRGAEVKIIEMNWRYRLLDKISHPNVAYILLILGIYGLIFELSNPGAILPGVVGGIFLILAFYALQTLPVNYAGLLLIVFAIVLFVLEVKVTSYGILTIGGIVSMILGSLMLIDAPSPAMRISLSVILAAAVTTAAFFLFAVGMALKAQTRKPTTGVEGLIGEHGVARTSIDPEGEVNVHGEIWHAISDDHVKEGEKVEVIGVQGLQVKVARTGGGKTN